MTDVPDRLYDLPPSAKLVLKVLEVDGAMTQGQIAAESRLSKRTVRFALESLREADVVQEGVYFRDARKSLYSLADSMSTDESTAASD